MSDMTHIKINYYHVLGVSEEANEADIKRAYKKLAIKWHPDKNQENKEEAEEKFKSISEAYAILSDPQKKREYDNYRRGGFGFNNFWFDSEFGGGFGSPFSGFRSKRNPFDIFEQFFGRRDPFFTNFYDGSDEDNISSDDDFFGNSIFSRIGRNNNNILGRTNFKNAFDRSNFSTASTMSSSGSGISKSIRVTTQIMYGKKITKTETTTIDSQGNKHTESSTEESEVNANKDQQKKQLTHQQNNIQ